ncbi:MAG: serine--tRNA ligase, partial [Geminicoccaceae bacterium]
MIDLRWLRERPEAFDRALTRRGHPPAAASILELDVARREIETSLQNDQATRNKLSREIGQGSARGEKPSPELL